MNSSVTHNLTDQFSNCVIDNNKDGAILIAHRILEEFIEKYEQEEHLFYKEYPSHEKVLEFLETIEKDIIELLTVLSIIYNSVDLDYNRFTNRVFTSLLNLKKNNEVGYGYIWKQFGYYPSLLNFYVSGIFKLERMCFNELHEVMFKKIRVSFHTNQLVQYSDVNLIEKVNSYHLFNMIEGLSVNISDYFVNSSRNKHYEKVIFLNRRIYELLNPLIKPYLHIESANYFNLFEYFLGIVFMDIRLKNDAFIKFAPYGLNFRNFIRQNLTLNDDNFVFRYLALNKNEILKANFFGGEETRFLSSMNEYNILLESILNYR